MSNNLFVQIAALLPAKGDTLLLSVSQAGVGLLRVTITPHKRDPAKDDLSAADLPHLITRPIVATATPEELDSDLPTYLTRTAATVRTLDASLLAMQETLEAERKALEKETRDLKSKRSSTAYPRKKEAKPKRAPLFALTERLGKTPA